ncbi:cullin-1-like isoform X4 [Durio zibethinus]|uniref:Cullin-1-like isoform X4 n=1 Tax=Durio zibethinus TaxID=66656 RepID=A0A6P5WWW8_DURZI|nr:cullin-1-like isoform X4 [Durio zibethinus]
MILKYIPLDEGMMIMDEAIVKAKKIVEGYPETKFSGEEYQRFFEYLDRFFIPQHIELESLNGISFSCFRDLVFKKLYCRLVEATLTLINQERDGLQIDWFLLKNVLDIFVEISDYRGVNYYEDFEKIILTEISGYYSRLASEWLLYDSSAEYVQKVFWCLNREKQRASQYLHPDTEVKIVQVVRYQLLDQIANKLMEKKQAENSGVVTDYQEILSKCAGMTLQEGSSSTSPEEWLSKLMASSAHIC